MNTVRLKLQPVTAKVNGRTLVGGLTVSLASLGKGTSLVTTTAQPALIEILEMPARGDSSQSTRVLFSMAGTVVDSSGVAVFTWNGTAVTAMFTLDASDFTLEMAFDGANFKGMSLATLVLPWEAATEGFTMELGARVTVGGTVESQSVAGATGDILDVGMTHLKVPDDGDPTSTDTSTCIGVGTVYPTRNDFLKTGERIPFKGMTLNVFLEDAIGQRVTNIVANSYTLAAFSSALATIMTDAGFTAPNVTEFTFTGTPITPAALALWKSDATTRIAGKGTAIPYFDFWVFLGSGAPLKMGDAGLSEGKTGWSVTAATKTLATPTFVFLRSGLPYTTTLSGIAASDVPSSLATVVAHEIGHGLGLLHGLKFNVSSGGSYAQASRIGTMTKVVNSGSHAFPQLYGPVHKAALKTFYL